MTRTRIRLVEYGLTAIGTIGILALFGLVLWVSFYFRGVKAFCALAAISAIFVVFYKISRWCRYPGTLCNKSAQRLLADALLSILFVWGIPLLALVALLHLHWLVSIRKILTRLDLEFRFRKREYVSISPVAPEVFFPGRSGYIQDIDVLRIDEGWNTAQPAGIVVYRIAFGNTTAVVPEEFILLRD